MTVRVFWERFLELRSVKAETHSYRALVIDQSLPIAEKDVRLVNDPSSLIPQE